MEPRGILRNKEQKAAEEAREQEFDRQEVIRNTRLNAQLAAEGNCGEVIRANIAEVKGKGKGDDRRLPEHLKWDEINLYRAEQEKAATMKIDEPKTPYEGGFDPEGEYYREDRDDERGPEEIPELSLGEGKFDPQVQHSSLNGGELWDRDQTSQTANDNDDVDSDHPPLSAEERHKNFEEMRKAHYRNAANPLKSDIDGPQMEL